MDLPSAWPVGAARLAAGAVNVGAVGMSMAGAAEGACMPKPAPPPVVNAAGAATSWAWADGMVTMSAPMADERASKSLLKNRFFFIQLMMLLVVLIY
jgi:hypothetical protein